ncbi:MAG: MBL fold metallo-hydrolase [Clostridia bacterium]|nr:MBL fold metallo-hydrolase [Clostridia bacterium]
MNIKRIITNGLEENCYIVSDGDVGAIVDPGGCAEYILSVTRGLSVKHIFLTHGHFDHILAANELRSALGAKVYVSAKDAPLLKSEEDSLARDFGFKHDEIFFDETVKDGDKIKVGKMMFEVIETPGHTDGCVCYRCGNALFSGDTLFKLSIGVHSMENAETIYASIKKLMRLPEDTHVFPGHNDDTTIGFEKKNNPYASVK